MGLALWFVTTVSMTTPKGYAWLTLGLMTWMFVDVIAIVQSSNPLLALSLSQEVIIGHW